MRKKHSNLTRLVRLYYSNTSTTEEKAKIERDMKASHRKGAFTRRANQMRQDGSLYSVPRNVRRMEKRR